MTHPCPMCGAGEHDDWRRSEPGALLPGREHRLENSGATIERRDGEVLRRDEWGEIVTRAGEHDAAERITTVGPPWEDLPDAWGNPRRKSEEEAP